MNALPLYTISVVALPLLLGITLHEAAHAYAARALGDSTASMLGRVSLNPLRHVDPFGTVFLPLMLMLSGSPFLFGWAKPVPVVTRKLRHGLSSMSWVALAGPLANLGLAIVSAALIRFAIMLPSDPGLWVSDTLDMSVRVNVVLAVFNMLPLPPLDGAKVLGGVLTGRPAQWFAGIERQGMLILMLLLFVLPFLGQQMHVNLNILGEVIGVLSGSLLEAIDWLANTPVSF